MKLSELIEDIKYTLITIIFICLMPLMICFLFIIHSRLFNYLEDYAIKKGWIK